VSKIIFLRKAHFRGVEFDLVAKEVNRKLLRKLGAIWKQYPDPRVWYWTAMLVYHPQQFLRKTRRGYGAFELQRVDKALPAFKRVRGATGRPVDGRRSTTFGGLDLIPFHDSKILTRDSSEIHWSAIKEALEQPVVLAEESIHPILMSLRREEECLTCEAPGCGLEDDEEPCELCWEASNKEAKKLYKAADKAINRLEPSFYRRGILRPARYEAPTFWIKMVPWVARHINAMLKGRFEEIPRVVRGRGRAWTLEEVAAHNTRGDMVPASKLPAPLGAFGKKFLSRLSPYLLRRAGVQIEDALEFDRVDVNSMTGLVGLATWAELAHLRLADKLAKKALGPYTKGYPTVSFVQEGKQFTLFLLDTKEAYKEESEKMSHCIGLSSGYWKRAQKGEMIAYSLRDEERPYLTFNFVQTEGQVSWALEQCKGFGDALIGQKDAVQMELSGRVADVGRNHPFGPTVDHNAPMSRALRKSSHKPVISENGFCQLVKAVFDFVGATGYDTHYDVAWCRGERPTYSVGEWGEDAMEDVEDVDQGDWGEDW